MSSSNCCFLTCIRISQEAGQVVWPDHLFKNFPGFVMVHTVKGLGIVNKAEIDVFLELSCFFDDPTDIGNLMISGSSDFSKSSLNFWKFTVHLLLKPGFPDYSGQKDYFLSGFLKPTMAHYSATGTFLKELPSHAHFACHIISQWIQDVVLGRERDLIWEPADWEDSSLMLQNNHLVRAWMPDSFNDQTWGEVRKQSKKITWFLQMSPRMASLGERMY